MPKNYTPVEFERSNMSKAQEMIWQIAFSNAMMKVRHPDPDLNISSFNPSLEDQAREAASFADLVASLTPVDTLPIHSDPYFPSCPLLPCH